jgi:hypothetical protein
MAALVFSSFVALAALVGFALAVAWVRRYPPIGVALICLMIIPLWEKPALFHTPIVALAGGRLYLWDVATLLLFAAGTLQVRQLRANLRGWLFAWVSLGVLLAVALLRAIAVDGLANGVNSARWLLYFFFAMTWALGVRPDRLRLRTVSLVLGWALVLIAVYHGVTHGFGGAGSKVSAGDGLYQTGRILVAQQSMALLLCAATVFLGPSGSAKSLPRFHAVSALVFGGVVVVAQHRSVWAAGALGTVAVLIWSARRRARKQIFVQLFLGAWVVLVAGFSGMLGGSAISESALNTGTYEWRATGWQVLISQAIARGPLSITFGEPSASIFLRRLASGQSTSVSAHNWYLDVLLYMGVIGLILLLAMLVSALMKSRSAPAAWTFVLAAVATYGWAYAIEWYLVPWLGVATTVSLGAGRIAEGPVPTPSLVARPDAEQVRAFRGRPAVSSQTF